MREERESSPLTWITKRHAVNPANIVTVFHGSGGEIQITLVGGDALQTSEGDLTPSGVALLLPVDRSAPQPSFAVR
jgi:hypothetical protein